MPIPLLIGSGAISASAALAWIIRMIHQEHEHETPTTTPNQHDDDIDIVSSRGRTALNPPLPYLGAFLTALQNPCDVDTNPEGMIALCMAENKLILKDLSQRLNRKDVAEKAFLDEGNYCYNDMRGMMHVRESVARFLTRKFLKPMQPVPIEGSQDGDGDGNHDGASTSSANVIDAENVILGSGCASLLNGLFFSLAEAGEAVLIPSPYYAAFENDMKIVAQCVPHQVPMMHPAQGPTVDDLDASFEKAAALNLKPKILLLTNPSNPLGTIYSAETIRNAVDWARSRGMHTVVDEIYGLSVHDTDDTNFQSVTKILDNNLGNDVHFLWALSKDFGSSGFRVGVLYTQNQVLNSALANLNIFSSVSHPMQAVVADLLDDEVYVDRFLNTSRELLKSSYGIVVTALEELNIPYVKAQAGIFVYIDFSSLLQEPTFESEAKFASLLSNNARMVLTPGHCQRDCKPGMFRLCYAWITPDVLKVAMERLKRLVADLRKNGWEEKVMGQTDYFKNFTSI